MSDDELEAYEERAAIMEFDGGLTREQAEREAMKAIKNKQGSGYGANQDH